MQIKNILVTGASGLLGGNLCYLAGIKGYRVTGLINRHSIQIPGVTMVSMTEIDQASMKFDCIVHCAAMTNVDDCERNAELAYQVNVGLTGSMIELANRNNALLIHISTDAVYKDIPGPKDEQAAVDPLSVYARTKLEAEEQVRRNAGRFFVVRTNLFGFNILPKFSLAEWVIDNLSKNRGISGFFDVLFNPILANDLAEALFQLMHQPAAANLTLNIGSTNSISKYDFALQIADLFGLDGSLVSRVSVDDFGFIAPRSKHIVMDCTRFQNEFGFRLGTIEQGLQRFRQLYDEGYPNQLKKFNNN